jgi:antitoxin ParD1/3/4
LVRDFRLGPIYSSFEDTRMPISVDLGRQLERFIAKLVSSGRYNSKSEVLREGVRLIQERESRLAALDAAIARGIADAEAGRVKPVDAVFDRLEKKYRWIAKQDDRRHQRRGRGRS